MSGNYIANKKWREKHPEARNIGKKRHYKKTQKARNSRTLWNDDEIQLIMGNDFTDNELSGKLGRSVQAIQIKRSKTKTG